MAARQAPLLHGSAGQRGKPDDVAGRVDVRHIRLIVFIHFNFAALAGVQARGFNAQLIAVRLAAHGIEQSVRLNFLAALKFREHAIALRVNAHARDFLAEAKRSAHLPQMVGERLNNFAVHKIQQRGALVNQSDLGA